MKRYTSKRSCAVGLLFLLMFISLQAQAGNILISGSDGDTLHARIEGSTSSGESQSMEWSWPRLDRD